MRFPRALRLDHSDLNVYERAAEPDELCVSGGFAFAGRDSASLSAKERQALGRGWLGCESFGWTTLVAVAEIEEAEFARLVERLARHLLAHYGAPDLASAILAARAEADDAVALADHPVNTILSLERRVGPEGLVESFRRVEPPRERDHAKIWEIAPEGEES